ncbi:hypothetical protein P1X16_05355 [Hymenobacter sp. YC55]|nr:hypothetical protein [Hymenobacter sp. YC55]
MMATAPPDTYQVRAEVDLATELALKREQGRIQEATGKRPRIEQVVANVLIEWGKNRKTGG